MGNNIMRKILQNYKEKKIDKVVAKKVKTVLKAEKRDKKVSKKQRKISYELVNYFKDKKYDKNDKKFLTKKLKELLKLELKSLKSLEKRKIKLVLRELGDHKDSKDSNEDYEAEERVYGVYNDEDGIVVINKSLVEEELASDDPNERIDVIMDIIETLIHEAIHCKQRIMIRSGVCTREILKLTKNLFYADTFNEGYNSNYNQIVFEHEAESKALKKQNEMFKGLMDKERGTYEEFCQKELELQQKVPQFFLLNKPRNVDEVRYQQVYMMDFVEDLTVGQVIRERPWVIANGEYPILNRIYDFEGYRLYPKELLRKMKLEKEIFLKNKCLSHKEKKEIIDHLEGTYSEIMLNILNISNTKNIFMDLDEDEKKEVRALLVKAKELAEVDKDEVTKKSLDVKNAYIKASPARADAETADEMKQLLARENLGEKEFLRQTEERNIQIKSYIDELER